MARMQLGLPNKKLILSVGHLTPNKGFDLLIKSIKMPNASDAGTTLNLLPTSKRLLKTPHFLRAVVALFFYVGAQICVWSFSIRYVMAELDLFEADASTYYVAALILFAVSRFIFTGLMRFISPGRLLLLSALMATLCTVLVIVASGYIAVFALVAISGFMSLMFPTIFGLGLTGLGDDTKIAASFMMMAISGGAILTGIQGLVSDMTESIHISYCVPLVCFIIIAFYASKAARLEKRI
jgi:FHS family L-fucose permease-like MFS transporter